MDELLLFLKRDSDQAPSRIHPDERHIEIPENEGITLEFRGHQAHRMEARHLECPGEIRQIEPTVPRFIWRPFEHLGKVAYGWMDFVVRPPESRPPLRFSIKIVPSRLGLEHWNILFDDVRRVADALVTQWLNDQNPHVGGLALRATKFSPATAMAELKEGWDDFAASLHRIVRKPRLEFRPGSPMLEPPQEPDVLPDPVRDGNIYENRLVALTVERLAGTLRRIRRRAKTTMLEADGLLRTFYKDAHSPLAVEEAQRTLEKSRQMADVANDRATFLQRTRRKLPVGRGLASARTRVPHITPRIRHHPDYNRVIRWYRSFGHQRLAFSSQEFLSALGTRRASDIYEYWTLFALFSALGELGYRPQFQQASELIREDVLDLEPWSDQPVSFIKEDESEILTVWYERKARYLPGQSKRIKKQGWKDYARGQGAQAPPGLYSRTGPMEPDFWFELHKAEAIAVGVGDAIFSEGVDASGKAAAEDVLRKANKVSQYASDLILVEKGGRVLFPLERGLVVFCGNETHAELLEDMDVTHSIFLPLRPLRASGGENSRQSIPLDASSLAILRRFLEQLRQSLSTSGS